LLNNAWRTHISSAIEDTSRHCQNFFWNRFSHLRQLSGQLCICSDNVVVAQSGGACPRRPMSGVEAEVLLSLADFAYSTGGASRLTPIIMQGSVPRTLQAWFVTRMMMQSPGVRRISSTFGYEIDLTSEDETDVQCVGPLHPRMTRQLLCRGSTECSPVLHNVAR
jgi:hypothetical protein